MKTFFIATEFEADYFTGGLKKISDSLYEGDFRVIISGPGMVNMAAAVSKAAEKYPNDEFLNIGIAGASSKLEIGEVREIQRFIICEYPAVPEKSRIIWDMSYPKIEKGPGTVLCTSIVPVWKPEAYSTYLGDMIDMEGYAYAKVCNDRGINFKCFKAVSDRLKKNSQEEFMINARTALNNLKEFILKG